MNDGLFLIQYCATEHDSWKDDNMRYPTKERAAIRLAQCRTSKILRNCLFRIVQRSDKVVV